MYSDVGLTSRFSYDGEECLRLYVEYLKKGSIQAMEDLLCYVKRHVTIRVRKHYFRRVRLDICEDLIQSSVIELWDVFSRKSVPHSNVAVFHSFINTVVHRKMAKTFALAYDDAPKSLDANRYVEEQFSRMPSSEDSEDSLFVQELPEALKWRVVERVRFRTKNAREAVSDILDRILIYKEPVVESWLKRKWGVEDPQFLLEHVLVLLRDELYKVRQEMRFRTNSEKREVLNEGIEEILVGDD